MAGNRLLTSLTRIADFGDYEIMPLARAEWAWGDYVVGEVIAPPSPSAFIELRNGRLTTADVGDQLVGAFATRFATLEATGSWQEIALLLSGGGLHAQRVVSRAHYDIEAAKRSALEFAGMEEYIGVA